MREQTIQQLLDASSGTVELLPGKLQAGVMDYIDTVNLNLSYEQSFWQGADVALAFERILGQAIALLDLAEWIATPEDARRPENDDLAFNLFQIRHELANQMPPSSQTRR